MKKRDKNASAPTRVKSTPDNYAIVDKSNKSKESTSILDEEKMVNTISIMDEKLAVTNIAKQAQSTHYGKSVRWWMYGLIALIVIVIAGIVAVAVAYALIAGLRSEISAVKLGLNYRCQQLYITSAINFSLIIHKIRFQKFMKIPPVILKK